MAQIPKLNVSGFRGIWGDTLTLSIAENYAKAFSLYIKNHGGGTVLVARDGRESGSEIVKKVCSTLVDYGIDIIYGDILPTPTVLISVRDMSYAGAIIITASHNPIEYNGLKFVRKGGSFANGDDINEINNALEIEIKESVEKGKEIQTEDFMNLHIKKVLQNVDVNLIMQKKFKVALDPVNASGCVITPKMLEQLNCDVKIINGEQNGKFGRVPEPTPKNLTDLSQTTKDFNADVGFAQDPDADRLVIVDEEGVVLDQQYTLVLGAMNVLQKENGDAVVNLSTSHMTEMINNKFGGKTFYSKVGEPNVVAEMIARKAVVGGEGSSSGIIYPRVQYARDSLVGIALVLELMAKENKKLSEIVKSLPPLFMGATKIPVSGDINLLFEKFKNTWPDASINNLDGLRFDNNDGSWVQVRASNTESIVRVMYEANSSEQLKEITKTLESLI